MSEFRTTTAPTLAAPETPDASALWRPLVPKHSSPRSTSSSAAYARPPRPDVPGRARPLLARFRRPADAALLRRAARPRQRGGARDLPQARRSEPHRRAQDQQRASARRCSPGGWASSASSPRPAPASTAWPRPPSARCFGFECVVYMGEEDMRAPGAERLPHAAARRRGAPGRQRHAHAEGRHQRGDPRLGDQRRDTHYIIGSVVGPAPVPAAWCATSRRSSGARRAAQMLERDGAPAGRGHRLRRRRLERHGHLPRLRGRRRACALIGVEAAGEGIETRRARGALTARPRRRAARRALPTCCRTSRPGGRGALDLGRPRLPRGRPGALVPEGQRPRRVT